MTDNKATKFGWSILRITLATGAGLLMLWGCLHILDLTLETSSTSTVLDFDDQDTTVQNEEVEVDKGTDPHFDMRMS